VVPVVVDKAGIDGIMSLKALCRSPTHTLVHNVKLILVYTYPPLYVDHDCGHGLNYINGQADRDADPTRIHNH
jgi:hypothetical protein